MADTVPQPRAPRKTKPKAAEVPDNGSNGSNGSDAPPQSEPRASRAASPKPRANSLEARLAEFISVAAVPFAATGDQYSATIIAQRAPALASSLSDLANENANIKRVLNRMLEGGAWGGVALSFASIVIPICQRYGAIPGDDPFKALNPGSPDMPSRGIPSPPAGFGGWSEDFGGVKAAPTPPPPPPSNTTPPAAISEIPPNGNPDDIPQYIPGAPPGVVTVAASRAGHADAR